MVAQSIAGRLGREAALNRDRHAEKSKPQPGGSAHRRAFAGGREIDGCASGLGMMIDE